MTLIRLCAEKCEWKCGNFFFPVKLLKNMFYVMTKCATFFRINKLKELSGIMCLPSTSASPVSGGNKTASVAAEWQQDLV